MAKKQIKLPEHTCKVCKKYMKNTNGLGAHLRGHNLTVQKYYDMFKKKEGEGICDCGKQTKFKRYSTGYHEFCSPKCLNQSEYHINKGKQTKLEKYGDERYCNADKIRQTKFDRGYSSVLKRSDAKNPEYILYTKNVWYETNKHKKELYATWDGLDFYTREPLILKEQYLLENPNKHANHNVMRPTIDHQTSVLYGFLNNIDAKVIGSFDNLCICSQRTNSTKGPKCKLEFMERL
jgi:hypothetical protein